MRTTDPSNAAHIELLLAELRLPAIKLIWASLAAQADKEGWPAGRFLAALAEHEIAERSRRRLERHLAEAEAGATPEIVGRLLAEARRNRPNDRMIHAYAFMLGGGARNAAGADERRGRGRRPCDAEAPALLRH